ncbi:M24 family metallopeptidase [Bacteroidota bacterium]
MRTRRDFIRSAAYSTVGFSILGQSGALLAAPANILSKGEPLETELSKGLNRPRLDRLMKEEGIDAIIASSRNNIGYLTDMYMGMGDRFTAIQNYIIYETGNDVFSFVGELDWSLGQLLDADLDKVDVHLSDGAWYNSFHGELTERDQKMIELMERNYSPALDPGDTGALIEAIRAKNLGDAVVGVEDKMSMNALEAIRVEFPKIQIKNAHELLVSTRSVKNAYELEIIRRATKISYDALEETHHSLNAGMSAAEIMDLLSHNMKKRGSSATGVSADLGTYPCREDNYKLKRGDLVVLDAVNSVDRRYGDLAMSRVFDGKASDRLLNSHKALANGIQACVDTARPGITISDLCIAIEKGVQEYYPGYSRSRNVFGHSLGVECPELPILTIGNQTILEPGMTLNPDILVYDYGLYMLLSENTIIVTEKGSELITPIEQSIYG